MTPQEQKIKETIIELIEVSNGMVKITIDGFKPDAMMRQAETGVTVNEHGVVCVNLSTRDSNYDKWADVLARAFELWEEQEQKKAWEETNPIFSEALKAVINNRTKEY